MDIDQFRETVRRIHDSGLPKLVIRGALDEWESRSIINIDPGEHENFLRWLRGLMKMLDIEEKGGLLTGS